MVLRDYHSCCWSAFLVRPDLAQTESWRGSFGMGAKDRASAFSAARAKGQNSPNLHSLFTRSVDGRVTSRRSVLVERLRIPGYQGMSRETQRKITNTRSSCLRADKSRPPCLSSSIVKIDKRHSFLELLVLLECPSTLDAARGIDSSTRLSSTLPYAEPPAKCITSPSIRLFYWHLPHCLRQVIRGRTTTVAGPSTSIPDNPSKKPLLPHLPTPKSSSVQVPTARIF